MSYLCIMTFWFCLAESNKLYRRHVYNSIVPIRDSEPSYNISLWVRQLHLQQCVMVEIGDNYCGIFVEYPPAVSQMNSEIEEYFLGLCDLATLKKWKLCPPSVEKERPSECVFQEHSELSNNPTRVHRRLCDVTGLAFYGDPCNCSSTIFHGQKLYEVTGFPTCFLPQLPVSLCEPGNVCGVYNCNASTINKIHTVKCDPQCLGGQPFCESTGPETTRASEIHSYWSDWGEPLLHGNESPNFSNGFIQSQAICINKNTGKGAVDCLGPGTNCCPANAEKCECYIYLDDGVLMLSRELTLKRPYYQLKRSLLNNHNAIFSRYLRSIKNFRKPKTFFAGENVIRRKYFEKGKKFDEGDYEDDDEDTEDLNDEDIILEEDQSDKEQILTTEEIEKSEIKQNQHVPESNNNKIVIEAMAKDVNQTDLGEESKAAVFSHDVMCFNFIIFSYMLF